MDLSNKEELIKYLKQNHLWAKKSLGQNFLIDRGVLDKMIVAAELKKSDTVLEIGPGIGTLTCELLRHAVDIISIEKDDRLAELLKIQMSKSKCQIKSKIQIIKGDVLDLDFNDIFKSHPEFISGSQGMLKQVQHDRGRTYKLVANIPYYITSKILEKFLTAEDKPELIVLLVQKEVAERICARPGQMSVMSIAVQFYGEPEIIATVKSSSFWPEPKVDSAILKIKNKISNIKNIEAELFKIIKVGFRSRRKTLVNNLMVGTNPRTRSNKYDRCGVSLKSLNLSREELFDILDMVGLQNNIRAQELSVEKWIELSKMLDVKCQM